MRSSVLKVWAAAAVLGPVLAGCTGGSPAGSGTEEATGADAKSIRYLVESPEDPATLKTLDTHLQDFEKSSGIDVELEAMPQDSMRTVLQTQLRSGEGPDVFNWGSGPGFAGALANAGLLYDLTDAYEKYDWQVYDFAKERVTFDGKTYGVPGEMETIGLYYNQDLLKKLGVAPPRTVTELKSAAAKIRAAGITPIAASDKEGWQGGHLLSMALSSEVGSEGMQQLLDGEKPWDSPEVVRALKLWEDLNRSGDLTKSPTSVGYDSANSMFYSGKAAMNPTGSWLVTELDTNADFKVGYMPFPGPDGPGIFTGGLGSGPFISAGTAKKDAALELVDFLASPEHARWTVEKFKTIPPSPVDTTDVKVSPLFRTVLKDATRLSDGSADFGYNIDVLASDVFNDAMYDGVQGILSGQSSAEEVAKSLEAASKK
jgi:raffinose/stachyose/melibiose transport system substrate-binding protein